MLVACTETFEIDFPEMPQQLVVYSLFHPDSVWQVSVSATKDLNSPGAPYPVVSEATVEIYQGERRVDELVFQGYLDPETVIDNLRGTYDTVFWREETIYRSERGIRPEPGIPYTVRVSAPGFSSVEATSSIPSGPSATLGTSRINRRAIPSGSSSQLLELSSTINDVPGENNFYLVGASYLLLELQAGQDGIYDDTVYYREYSALETANIQSIRLQNFKLFSDQSFYGIAYPVTFNLTLDDLFILINPDSLTLYLGEVSEPFYRYYQSLEAQGDYGVDFVNLTDPPKAYSNVEGGLGVFAGYNTVDFSVYRKDFE